MTWSRSTTCRLGRGVNLLLNATPDSHGEVPAAQMKRLAGIRRRYSRAFRQAALHHQGEGNNLSLDFGSEQTIDHIVLREDIRGGERVRKFLVEGRRADGTWLALARGTQVGSRQIIPIPATAVTGFASLWKRASLLSPFVNFLSSALTVRCRNSPTAKAGRSGTDD